MVKLDSSVDGFFLEQFADSLAEPLEISSEWEDDDSFESHNGVSYKKQKIQEIGKEKYAEIMLDYFDKTLKKMIFTQGVDTKLDYSDLPKGLEYGLNFLSNFDLGEEIFGNTRLAENYHNLCEFVLDLFAAGVYKLKDGTRVTRNTLVPINLGFGAAKLYDFAQNLKNFEGNKSALKKVNVPNYSYFLFDDIPTAIPNENLLNYISNDKSSFL